MPFDAKAIANEFLDVAEQQGVKISPLKLQKLVYYAHGWHLAIQKQPLINELVEAWKWGPVIPSLYHEFKSHGSQPIESRATEADFTDGRISVYEPSIGRTVIATNEEKHFARKIVEKVLTTYGKYSAAQLSEATHKPGTPWALTRDENGEVKNADISNEVIQTYFESRAKKPAT